MKKLIIVLMVLFAFSCQKAEVKEEQKEETKHDYLQRVFYDQTEKQQYYTGKWIEATNKFDVKNMEAYCDSIKMASYSSHNAFVEMYKK